MAEAFLMVDANKDKMITKKEGEDAATSNFDRKEEEEENCDSCPNCEEKCNKKTDWIRYCDLDGDQQLDDITCDCGVCKVNCGFPDTSNKSVRPHDC